jgi:type IV secretion system protein VirB10
MNIEVGKPEGTIERDPRPIVGLPRRIPAALIAAMAVVAALLLFAVIVAQRRSLRPASSADELPAVYAPPPPLVIPTEQPLRQQFVPVIPVERIVAAPPPPSPPTTPQRQAEPLPQPIRVVPQDYGRPYPEDFRPIPAPRLQQQSVTAAPALVIDSGGGELAIGTLIPAVLETPIDTSRPGQVRAVVSSDARGQDGLKVLVPRGSRLVGEYQSDVRPGQNRVLVNWTRLIRPDGASVRLGIPSADETGAAGIPGNYHGFFLSRFFNSALRTAFSVGGNLIGRGNNAVILGLPGQLNAVAGEGLISNDKRPKITVKPGTLFNIFVARDVDFSGSAAAQ